MIFSNIVCVFPFFVVSFIEGLFFLMMFCFEFFFFSDDIFEYSGLKVLLAICSWELIDPFLSVFLLSPDDFFVFLLVLSDVLEVEVLLFLDGQFYLLLLLFFLQLHSSILLIQSFIEFLLLLQFRQLRFFFLHLPAPLRLPHPDLRYLLGHFPQPLLIFLLPLTLQQLLLLFVELLQILLIQPGLVLELHLVLLLHYLYPLYFLHVFLGHLGLKIFLLRPTVPHPSSTLNFNLRTLMLAFPKVLLRFRMFFSAGGVLQGGVWV